MKSLANLPVCDRKDLRYLADQYVDDWVTDPSTENLDELNAALIAHLAYNQYSPDNKNVDKALDDYTVAVHADKSDDVLKNVIALYIYMAARGIAEGPEYDSPKDLKRKVCLAQLKFIPTSHNNSDGLRKR
ncbi:unnamed protein product [Peniophora sp. CBMAI 1063]|nr:unnamed protein product [Peniophora sp. CBMAI 1063]